MLYPTDTYVVYLESSSRYLNRQSNMYAVLSFRAIVTLVLLQSSAFYAEALIEAPPISFYLPPVLVTGQSYNISWQWIQGDRSTVYLLESPASEIVGGSICDVINYWCAWQVPLDVSTAPPYQFGLVQSPTQQVDYSKNFSIVVAAAAPSFSGISMQSSATSGNPTAAESTATTASAVSSSVDSGSSTTPPSPGLGGGVIAGIVIGAVATFALTVIAVLLFLRYRRASSVNKAAFASKAELQAGPHIRRHELRG